MLKRKWTAVVMGAVGGLLVGVGVVGWLVPFDQRTSAERSALALDSLDSKVSYSMGVAVARKMKRQRS